MSKRFRIEQSESDDEAKQAVVHVIQRLIDSMNHVQFLQIEILNAERELVRNAYLSFDEFKDNLAIHEFIDMTRRELANEERIA